MQVTWIDQAAPAAWKGGTLCALRQTLPLIAPEAKTVWIHCAKPGTWKGHQAGEFTFDPKLFAHVTKNFERCQNPVPLTYEHPEHRGDDGIAAGWVHELKVRDDGLWALAELTDKAAEHIRCGEYRFCSVVIDFESVDRESADDVGPELLEIGLTNVPFIDGLTAIRLSRRAAGSTRSNEMTLSLNLHEILKMALKELPEDATKEQLAAFVDGEMLKRQATGDEEAPAEGEPAPEAEATNDPEESVEASDVPAEEPAAVELQDPMDAAKDQAMAAIEGLAGELGVEVPAVIALLQDRHEQIVKVLSSPEGEAAPEMSQDDTKAAALSRITALSKQLKERDSKIAKLSSTVDELHGKQCERDVSDDIERGLFSDVQKDALVKLRRTNPEVYEELRGHAESSPAVPVGTKVHASRPSKGDEPDNGEGIAEDKVRDYETMFAFIRDPEKRRAKAIECIRDFNKRQEARN